MSLFLDLLSWVLLGAGGLLCMIGGLGLLRLPDFYTRLHAAGIIDTLGITLVLAGLMVQAGWSGMTIKLILILIFQLIVSPTATHALSHAALNRGLEPVVTPEEESP